MAEPNLPLVKDIDWLGTNQELATQLAKDHPGREFRFMETRKGRFRVEVLPPGLRFTDTGEIAPRQADRKDDGKMAGVLYGTIIHHGQAYRVYGPADLKEDLVKDILTSDANIHTLWFGPDVRLERV